MGMLIGFGSNQTSIHHNLFAHNNGRNPLILGGTNHEFIDNVIYDWGYSSEFLEDGNLLNVDIAGNYWKPLSSVVDSNEFPIALDFDSSTAFGSQIYCENNLYLGMPFLTPAQIQSFGGNAVIISDVSLLDAASTVTFNTPEAAYDTVLVAAGALHPQRDLTDARVAQNVHHSTGNLVDCIYPDPITLDSGNVIAGSDTSIIYDQLNQNPAISPEGRRIEIVNGTGAGQSRLGVGVNVIDSAARIVEAIIDTPWIVIPDSTSQYKVIVTCNHYIGSYPVYLSGIPPADTDHDGMPDDWEINQGLSPNNPNDRNGFDLDTFGYTNLEVYLNGFYASLNTGVKEVNSTLQVKAYPNPFTKQVVIEFGLNEPAIAEINIYNAYGGCVKSFSKGSVNKNHIIYWDGTNNNGVKLSPGTYFIEIRSGSFTQTFKKVVMLK